MTQHYRAAALAFIFALPVSAASAAVVTDHFDISLPPSAFTDTFGGLPPSTVKLSFDLTFDPTIATTSDVTTGFSNVTYNFSLGSTLAYQVTASDAPGLPNTLIVGGTNDGVGVVDFGTNDFYMHVTHVATDPTFQQFGLTTASSYNYTPTYASSAASVAAGVTFTGGLATTPSVPLPASLPMFGAALVGLAGFRRLRHKRSLRA